MVVSIFLNIAMFPDKCCEDKDELHYCDNCFDQDFLYIVYNGAWHVAGDQ